MDNKLTVKDSSIAFISSFILCQLGTMLFAVIGLIVASMFGFSSQAFYTFLNSCLGCSLLGIAMDIIIILCYLVFNRNKENKIFNKPNPKKLILYICLAVLCFLTLYPVVNSVNSIIYKFFPQSSLTYPLTTGNYFISLISLALLPAIAEELLFRGVIFKGLQKTGNTFAIVVSAIMFALYHCSLEQTIYPLLTGLVFAVIMCYENNILYCIAMHFTNNFLALTLQYFNVSLFFKHFTYYIIAIICFIAFIALIIIAIKKLCKNNLTKTNTSKEDKVYLIGSLSIMFVLWLAVQLTTIF